MVCCVAFGGAGNDSRALGAGNDSRALGAGNDSRALGALGLRGEEMGRAEGVQRRTVVVVHTLVGSSTPATA